MFLKENNHDKNLQFLSDRQKGNMTWKKIYTCFSWGQFIVTYRQWTTSFAKRSPIKDSFLPDFAMDMLGLGLLDNDSK